MVWSYAATFFTVGAGVILLPFMLHKLPAETIAIWTIFQTVSMLVMMLDFGFRPSFSRNVSYIFSGVRHLHKEGIEAVESREQSVNVDYSLLKGTLHAMRLFYRWMSLVAFVILISIGSFYIYFLLGKYTGSHTDIWVAWFVLVSINCYNLYTLYYDALLTGKGFIRRSQQINIIGHIIYLGLAIALIYSGLGLTAIVTSQFISIVIRRIFSYRVFFTSEMTEHLRKAEAQPPMPILRAIYPNAVKSGLTSIGGFMVNKSAMFIGSLFLPLPLTASYGITLQVMDVLSRCGVVVYTTTLPKLAQHRVHRNYSELRRLYSYSIWSLLAVFIIGGIGLLTLGNPFLLWLNSETTLLPASMICAMLAFFLLEYNHVIAAGIIMADNRIPFFIPSLLSGLATIVLMLIFVAGFHWSLWGMILAPGIAQLAYQNWRWPMMVIKELYSSDYENKRR